MRSTWIALSLFCLASLASADDWETRFSSFEEKSPGVGDKARDFSVRKIASSEQVTLDSLLAKGPLVVEFVCLSSPEACNQAERAEIRKAYADRAAQFALIYVREETGEGLLAIEGVTQPSTIDARLENARQFRTKYAAGTEVFVDPITNPTWKDYGRLPNSMFVIAPDGTVLFRDAWAGTDTLRAALGEVYAGGFDKLRPEPDPKNLAAREEKKPEENTPEDRNDGQQRQWDRLAAMQAEYEPWTARGKKVADVARESRPKSSDPIWPYIKEATNILLQKIPAARARNDMLGVFQGWTEYKRYVERLEKELGIVHEDGKDKDKDRDSDRRDRGDRDRDKDDRR